MFPSPAVKLESGYSTYGCRRQFYYPQKVGSTHGSHQTQQQLETTANIDGDTSTLTKGKNSKRRKWLPLHLVDRPRPAPPEDVTPTNDVDQEFGGEGSTLANTVSVPWTTGSPVIGVLIDLDGTAPPAATDAKSRVGQSQPARRPGRNQKAKRAANRLNSTLNPVQRNPNPSHLAELKQLFSPQTAPLPDKPGPGTGKPRRRNKKKAMAKPGYVPPHLRGRVSSVTPSPPTEANGPKVDGGNVHLTPPTDVPPKGPKAAGKQPVKQVFSGDSFQPADSARTPKQSNPEIDVKVDNSVAAKYTSSAKLPTGSTNTQPPSGPASPQDMQGTPPKGLQSSKFAGGHAKQSTNSRHMSSSSKPVDKTKPDTKPSDGGWNPPHRADGGRWNKPNNRWPRTGKSGWLRASDLKRVDEEDADLDLWGGADVESNSEGDPDYHIKKLVDWSGNWNPAPVEWEGRKGYYNRNLGAHVTKWAKEFAQWTAKVDITDPRFIAADTDLAPRHWMVSNIEGESAQQFWRTLVSRAPEPMDQGDLEEFPWWDKGSVEHSFLPAITVPDAKLDPEDEGYVASQKDWGASAAILRKEEEKKIKARRAERRRKKAAEQYSARLEAEDQEGRVTEFPDQSLKPKANIYLRPAYIADVNQITDIYNHYVKNTVKTPEFIELTPNQMNDRLVKTTNTGLPYIVAIHRVNNFKCRKPGQLSGAAIEKVVGFADVGDYFCPGSVYRHSALMDMFVHPDYLHQGIGKCLLDRMLGLLDPNYIVRGGPEWTVRTDYLKRGVARSIQTINIFVPHAQGNALEIEWLAKFLKGFFFKKSGHLYSMGHKHGQTVDITTFQYRTGHEINPVRPPTNPL